jgi:hypothetical protein
MTRRRHRPGKPLNRHRYSLPEDPTTRYYLSFIDPNTGVFLGSAIIDATHDDLPTLARQLCPQGEAAHVEIPDGVTLPEYVVIGEYAPLAVMLARGEVTPDDLGPHTREHLHRGLIAP